MVSGTSLQQSIDDAIAGKEKGFEEVYHAVCDDVYRTVSFLVPSKADCQDVASEIFIELWRSLPSYDVNRPFRNWLHGLIIRQIHNWRRKRWQLFRLLERKKLLESLDASSSKIHEPEDDELILNIHKLSYKLRTVIILKYVHDYSYQEIAELLQIPAETAKSRHRLAIQQLRKHYASQIHEKRGNSYVIDP